jgi:hypothetical protein
MCARVPVYVTRARAHAHAGLERYSLRMALCDLWLDDGRVRLDNAALTLTLPKASREVSPAGAAAPLPSRRLSKRVSASAGSGSFSVTRGVDGGIVLELFLLQRDEMSHLDVEVPCTRGAVDDFGKAHTAFHIVVRYGSMQWTVQRRYTAFKQLHASLEAARVPARLPEFPYTTLADRRFGVRAGVRALACASMRTPRGCAGGRIH